MPRNPRGTIVRQLPEWNYQNMQAGSSVVGAIAANTFAACGLFNNDDAGNILVVWDCAVVLPPGGGQTPLVCRGSNFLGPISNGGAGQGTLYSSAAPVAGLVQPANPFTNPHTEFTGFPLNNGTWQWPHNWPLAFIAPGFSFVIDNDQNGSANFQVTFIWEVVPRL